MLNTVPAALLSPEGLPIESSTLCEARPFICITTEDEVAVKLAGVATVSVRPESIEVDVAAALTVTVVDVADEGTTPPEHPEVRRVAAVEVAALEEASLETTLKLYSVHATRSERDAVWLVTRGLVSASTVDDA